MDTNNNNQVLFGIQMKNGVVVKLAGKNITEAFAQTQKRTRDGNINFSILDFYYRVPMPVVFNGNSFQLYGKKNENSKLEPIGKWNDNFELLENLMHEKVRKEGYFYALVLETTNGNIWSMDCANA